MVKAMPRPLYPRERDPVPTVQVWWAPGPVWTGGENLAATGIRSIPRPSKSQGVVVLTTLSPPMRSLHSNPISNPGPEKLTCVLLCYLGTRAVESLHKTSDSDSYIFKTSLRLLHINSTCINNGKSMRRFITTA
jgi:hypothetical protein